MITSPILTLFILLLHAYKTSIKYYLYSTVCLTVNPLITWSLLWFVSSSFFIDANRFFEYSNVIKENNHGKRLLLLLMKKERNVDIALIIPNGSWSYNWSYIRYILIDTKKSLMMWYGRRHELNQWLLLLFSENRNTERVFFLNRGTASRRPSAASPVSILVSEKNMIKQCFTN